MWTTRIILEACLKEDNSFVTLTYEDDSCPLTSSGLGTLVPKDATDWLKRLRKRIEPLKVRYFMVGEYGDETRRPHYHLALFGYPSCRICTVNNKCEPCAVIHETWGRGFTSNDELTVGSAAYIAGYVVKKMTGKDDERLDGRHPEFARMSRVPGIGRDALFDLADTTLRYGLDEDYSDVTASVNFGRRRMPLGRYMRRQLRLMCGKAAEAPEATLAEAQNRLQDLRDAASKVAADAPAHVRREIFRASFADQITERFAQARTNQRTRLTIRGRKGRL